MEEVTVPYRLEVDGLAVPFWLSSSGGTYPKLACEGRELLPSRFEVLGTGRLWDTHVRGVSCEQVNATYMPKSAIIISDNGSFVWKRTFSSLSPGHLSGPKISQRGMKKGGEPRT